MQSKLNSLPELRFMPDGSIAESSPRAVKISDRDGISLWLAQARNGLRYEIRSTFDPSAAP
jgi:hypothetical protein